MSDVTTGSIFNPQFFMNPPWWLGRVEEKETWSDNIQGETFTSVAGIKGWGHRYKVRIFNWHTGELEKLPPKDMAFCQVIMPVTAGSGHGGASQTPSIESGSVVFGFFMDGMAGQEGYIVGVLGNSNNNVPRQRGVAAPNQPSTTPAAGGTPTVSKPATPPTGPGSLANAPIPPNLDQLSIAQLTKLLDPSKTPSSEVFKAATEARQKARAAKLPSAEVERQVLIATVRASRKPGGAAGSVGNCNQGYQQYNDTYTDGDPLRAAKVPDDRIVGGQVLSVTEAQHIETSAKTEQDIDSKKKIPLLDVCKKNNSRTKGIQRILKNLINAIEFLKKKYNQISAFATGVAEYVTQVQNYVFGAIEEVSRFAKDIINGIRGYILKTFQDQIKKIAPFLFPSEVPGMYQKVEGGMSLINCLFNKLIAGLKGLIANLISKLLDKFINAPLCAAEQFLGGIIDSILGPITSTLQKALEPLNSILALLSGGLGNAIGSLFGGGFSMFNALEFIPGILKFFSCDDEKECVKYNEISQDGSALPGGDAVPTPSAAKTNSPTGRGSNASQPQNANIVNSSRSSGTNIPTRRNIREQLGGDQLGTNFISNLA